MPMYAVVELDAAGAVVGVVCRGETLSAVANALEDAGGRVPPPLVVLPPEDDGDEESDDHPDRKTPLWEEKPTLPFRRG